MELSNDTLALIFIILFVLLLFAGILHSIFSKNKNRRSSINPVTLFGATSQFQTLDQKAATEHVLDVQADKKMDEEETGDPDKK